MNQPWFGGHTSQPSLHDHVFAWDVVRYTPALEAKVRVDVKCFQRLWCQASLVPEAEEDNDPKWAHLQPLSASCPLGAVKVILT